MSLLEDICEVFFSSPLTITGGSWLAVEALCNNKIYESMK